MGLFQVIAYSDDDNCSKSVRVMALFPCKKEAEMFVELYCTPLPDSEDEDELEELKNEEPNKTSMRIHDACSVPRELKRDHHAPWNFNINDTIMFVIVFMSLPISCIHGEDCDCVVHVKQRKRVHVVDE